IFLAIVLISMFTLRATTFGRSLYAIGANPTAARLAGIRTKRVIFFSFVLSGAAVGLTGLLLASQTGQGSGNAATGLEFSAITAVVLGGASLAGGRGAVGGAAPGGGGGGGGHKGGVLPQLASVSEGVAGGRARPAGRG